MIPYLFWAALELGYCCLALSAFFRPNCPRREAALLLSMLWGVLAVCQWLAIHPALPPLLRFVAMALILLFLFRENSGKGLLVLLGAFGVSVAAELGAGYVWGLLGRDTALEAPTAARLLLLALAWMLRWYRSIAGKKWELQELELRLQRQRMEMQTESIHALEQSYRQQRKSAHEFQRHLQVLQDLLDRGEAEQAAEYIRRLRGSRAGNAISVNTHNTVVDVVLDRKYRTAVEHGIHFQLRVNDLSKVAASADSLVVILGNLLDNAIEACRGLDGYREIDCTVLWDEGLSIVISNTSRPVRIVGGRIGTTKDDTLNHGFGLGNVCDLLDVLGADYTFDYDEGLFSFAADIPKEPADESLVRKIF